MGLAVAQLDAEDSARTIDVIAHDRAGDAHRLRLSGMGWENIAVQVGYVSGRVASLSVDTWLQKIAVTQAPEHRRQALQLELDRLDSMQSVFWPATMAGDRHAAEIVLKIIARRCKCLGFDKPDDTMAAPARTVVVGGTSEEYVATLKALIDGEEISGSR